MVSLGETKVTPKTPPTEIRTMTTTANNTSTNLAKFQWLLRELFQFDCADLDFGIYRIMNHKRDAVKRFISEQLPAFVDGELESGPLAQQAQAEAHREKVVQMVRAALGDTAIDHNGELSAAHHDLPIGRKYLEAQHQAADGTRSRVAIEAAIYNHLYSFFSRYYDEGDFISKRRYSRNQRYAIPYNGEEVYLHWANSDQYYVKTDEHFRNYDWKAPNGVTVHFRLKNADVEQNNVKGDRRFFIPLVSEMEWDADGTALTIPFMYRPLSGNETATYGKTNQQDKINRAAVSEILRRLHGHSPVLAALTGEHPHDDNGSVSHLEHHLRRYVQRNNADFFIHKDLAGFLNRELDFYLKNEVLNLDNLAVAGQEMSEGWFQQMRLTKAVGSRIIDFLAQIEDFQKMLWEKRKFVSGTQYCITLGSIDATFYPDILSNEAQWDEWRDLFRVDGSDRSEEFLSDHPTLVLDTRHFEIRFIDRLLASFEDLDGMTDGLLVHSENWQALRLLQEKYKSEVKCIYIDPPYNTGGSEFVYKNGYRHSSWMAMTANAVKESLHLVSIDGVNITSIDDYELGNLLLLMDGILGTNNRLGVLCVEIKPSGRTNDKFLATSHEYYLFHALQPDVVTINFFPLSDDERARYGQSDEVSSFKWRDFLRTGGYSTPEERPNSFYPVYLNPNTMELSSQEMTDSVEVLPIDSSGRRRVWRKTLPSFLEHLSKNEVRAKVKRGGGYGIEIIDRVKQGTRPKSMWAAAKYDAASHGTKLLNDILGISGGFAFPKSVHAVRDAIFTVTDGHAHETVCDYFAGSGTTGHAVINLNREDAGERKFILVEMGDYFDTVLLPRIKKVTYTPEWRDGKPQRQATTEEAESSPRIVKYIRLESYEDALDSIEFDGGSGQLPLVDPAEEYLLKYMLSWETKDSDTLLNAAKLASPFSYRLRVHANGEKQKRPVDLPETFNYLIGLKVQKREVFDDDGRRYLVFRGETRDAPGRKVAVIWRDTQGWTEDDFARDRDFVDREAMDGNADTVYVNGDSAIPGAKPIEPIFKARMFASVNV